MLNVDHLFLYFLLFGPAAVPGQDGQSEGGREGETIRRQAGANGAEDDRK